MTCYTGAEVGKLISRPFTRVIFSQPGNTKFAEGVLPRDKQSDFILGIYSIKFTCELKIMCFLFFFANVHKHA